MLSYLNTHWGVHEGRAKVYIFLGVGDDNALSCKRYMLTKMAQFMTPKNVWASKCWPNVGHQSVSKHFF